MATPARKPTHGSSQDAARLEALFSSIGEGVIATDDKGVVTRINSRALKLLHFKRAEVLGQRFPDKIVAVYENGSTIDAIDRPITKAFLTGLPVRTRTLYKMSDGSLLPVHLTVSPIIFRDQPIGAIEVFRDLSDEIESDKMKSDFISIASHQLRTPLSSIHMYTRMLHDGFAGPINVQQTEFIDIVLGSVERMNGLIDTLLNITRIESGGIVPHIQEVLPGNLILSLVAEILPDIEDKGLLLTSSIAEDVPAIATDPLLVKEVYANLLSNATKYTPVGGTVDVSLTDRRGDILLSVRDNGYGIPQKSQKHIFKKFYRAENVTKTDVSGTGLGLYLIKTIAETLGGELWFESQENVGSSFHFSLPKPVKTGVRRQAAVMTGPRKARKAGASAPKKTS